MNKDLYVCVMFDHMSSALWRRDGTEMDETEIPLPPAVIEALEDARSQYDCAPCTDDAPDNEADFCRLGYEIAKSIKASLPEWHVEFFNCGFEDDGTKHATPPVDLPINQWHRSVV